MAESLAPNRLSSLQAWLNRAWSQPARQRWLDHDARRLNLREWGRLGDRGVVLIHGGAAQTHWWDHIAPWLAVDRHVVAVDLSGHGDSSWRPNGYRLGMWADEVLAVADLIRIPQASPILIGHSMGGLVALTAAMRVATGLAGAIVLDVAARNIGVEEQARREARAGRRGQVFDHRAAALAAFRTLPDAGENQVSDIVGHVAKTSIHEVASGWAWKTDRSIFLRDALPLAALRSVDVPIRIVAAEHGILSITRAAEMVRLLGPRASATMLPNAGHHMMLDQPVALTECLRDLIADLES